MTPFVDTNLFIRYLTEDDPVQTDAVERLFIKVKEGKETVQTSVLVIVEIVWVLESIFKKSRDEIKEMIQKIINTQNLVVENRDILLQGLEIYSQKNIDFVDAYHAVFLKSTGEKIIYSFDQDFDKIEWIERREPA